MKTWLIVPDLHLDSTLPEHPAYRLVKKFAKTLKPDGVVFLGDVLDFDYISSFNKDDLKVLSAKSFQKDFDLWNRELDYWQTIAGSNILIRQGNHEERIERVLKAQPILEGAIELEEKCSYAKRGITYARQFDRPSKIGHCYFIHGWYTNQYHAKKHVTMMGDNICYGHTHDVQSYSIKAYADEHELCGWSMGCLCDTQPEWMKGKPTRWMHAFGIMYLDNSGQFSMYTVRILDGKFIWNGKVFK